MPSAVVVLELQENIELLGCIDTLREQRNAIVADTAVGKTVNFILLNWF